jgi:hypothetical protein
MRRTGTVGLIAIVAFVASATAVRAGGASELHATTPPVAGYWLSGADGGVFAFGNAPFYGSGVTVPGACAYHQLPGTLHAGAVCSGIAPTPSGNGYWLVNSFGFPVGFGHASEYAQSGCTASGPGVSGFAPMWTGMTSSATGYGFLIARSDGAVSGCGDGLPAGGLISVKLAAPIVGIASTPDHNGYWLVGADGGVLSFGNASFYGSMGGMPLNAPVVGITAAPDGKGYWLVAADGGVFSFGDAEFAGSMGGSHLNGPVVGAAASPDGKGYWLAASDGGVFSFGSAPFEGSIGGQALNAPVVGIAAYP